MADSEAERAAHVSSGALYKASDAGKCSRALAYRAAKIPESDPMDITGHWNTTLGRFIHDQWEKATGEALADDPTVDAAFEVEYRFLDGRGIVRIDAVFTYPGGGVGMRDRVVVFEGKSITGYGYKSAIGKVRRGTPAEGPRSSAVLQAAIGGLCADADEIVVGNWAKEVLSASTYTEVDNLARFVAEWTIPRETYEPLAKLELERVEGILALLDEGLLASRKIPGVPGEIFDPMRGRWEKRDAGGNILDTGTTWHCKYCDFQSLCVLTEPGRVDVEITRKAWPT